MGDRHSTWKIVIRRKEINFLSGSLNLKALYSSNCELPDEIEARKKMISQRS